MPRMVKIRESATSHVLLLHRQSIMRWPKKMQMQTGGRCGRFEDADARIGRQTASCLASWAL